ncbi:N-acetylmuramoyl-L-alanine amidase [Nocardioides terrae]|uniref:N-acetylmuramoyl-L-alanine amidase n=1 Tax=Nocardioides terrae TaxID=574651 RepID=A0A1I1DKS8_9ACTN|nr:FG-GAP-like repeat-containing protein [Nocardioides terrae]SFB75585.1 N-acetylmuramoyl-L-alanine amidase [Nocardioides terrae]
MHPQKSRFVALCQQTLVLGAVFAALVPAANVVNLDVVRDHPSTGPASAVDDGQAAMAAYAAVAEQATPVASSAADPDLHEVALTAPAGAVGGTLAPAHHGAARVVPAVATSTAGSAGSAGLHATTVADTATDTTTITSDPQDVSGYGTVGVTWEHGQDIGEGDISFTLRTQTDGAWSGWQELDYHDEHGPDAGTEEARHERPGTDEALVGHVDQVQVRAEMKSEDVPADLKLAVIDPGKVTATKAETPDIDTSELPVIPDAAPDGDGGLVEAPADPAGDGSVAPADPATDRAAAPAADTADVADEQQDGLALAAAPIVATKPLIYSRAQWGADERIREQTAPSYGSVHGGFVHHTVNANDYSAAEVPAIIRSIYAYHVRSRGWRDIGYNYLIDRFGRIWEGRYGGVDRNVVGAHTENYNGDSFGASAIGNFDIVAPPQAVVGAFGSLMGWKLAINGVSAAATNVKIGRRVFASSIMGHRDTKSTACPGRYLYARIPDIRKIAAVAQRPLSYAGRNANLAGSAYPDIIARRASDKRGVILPTAGFSSFSGHTSFTVRSGYTPVLSPDLTGDGRADLVLVTRAGKSVVRPGNGAGGFGKGRAPSMQQRNRDLITALGDVNGDRRNDLLSRNRHSGKVTVWLGRGNGTFRRQTLKSSFRAYNMITAGDVDGDHRVDLLARARNGVLWLYHGKGNGGFPHRRSLGGGWQAYDSIVAADFTKDGQADLLVRTAHRRLGYVRPNLGRGIFGAQIGPYRPLHAVGRVLSATNVMGDVAPDVLALTGRRVDVLNRGSGTDLGQPIVTNLDLSRANLVLNAGDWNRDGHGDVFYRETDGTLYLTLGNGAGSFSGRYSIGNFRSATMITAPGDVDGDGRMDLMAALSGTTRFYPGNGSTGVTGYVTAYGGMAGQTQISAGAWDADSTPDLLVRNGNALQLYPGNGPAGLGAPRTLPVSLAGYDWVIGVGALEVTGHPDLIVRTGAGALYALQGNADGSLAKPKLLGSGFGGYDLAG